MNLFISLCSSSSINHFLDELPLLTYVFFVFRHCIAKIQPPLFVVKVNKKVENLTYKVYFLSCYLYWILTFWHCSIDWLFMTFVNVQFISLFAISKYIQCLKSSGSKALPYATLSFKISYELIPPQYYKHHTMDFKALWPNKSWQKV